MSTFTISVFQILIIRYLLQFAVNGAQASDNDKFQNDKVRVACDRVTGMYFQSSICIEECIMYIIYEVSY